jgi:predicted MPP superfamily phosphohydrolase
MRFFLQAVSWEKRRTGPSVIVGGILFGTILISVCTVMHLYVFWRAASVPFVMQHASKKTLIAAAVLLWILFYLGRTIGHGGTGAFAAVLEFLGMTWMAVLLLTFVCLLAVDMATLFGLLMPKAAPSLRGWALLAGAVLSAIALFQGLRPPVVEKYEVRLSGLPEEMDGTVLVALSDMHIGTQIGRRWVAARTAQVNALNPDLVVLLGDIFEGHGPPSGPVIDALKALSAPLGVWAVFGNHESHGGSGMELFDDAQFTLLRNRWAEPAPGLLLAGVDDFTAAHRRGNGREFITQALEGSPGGAAILLSHTPWYSETAADAGVDLMMSGHTHGGQLWPFGYLARRRYPLFEGRYQVGPMTVIVCRGAGTWGPRMRLWRPGEILHVTLRGKERRPSESPSFSLRP